jgi:hypothetical protein
MEIGSEEVQKRIENVASLGGTAETYLVYKNNKKTYLATNRVVKEGKTGDLKSGLYIDKGFTESGTDIKYGSLGEVELVGYMPIYANNLNLSMQTTVSYADIISPTIDGSDYFEQIMKDHKYHNIMLIGSNGHIFYSIVKGNDYKKNILTDKDSESFLSRAVQKVIQSKHFYLQ